MHMKKSTLRQQNYRLRTKIKNTLRHLDRLIVAYGEDETLTQAYKNELDFLTKLELTKGEKNVRKK